MKIKLIMNSRRLMAVELHHDVFCHLLGREKACLALQRKNHKPGDSFS